MDLKELYQEIILDHGKNPRNKGKCDGYTNDAKAHNPLCGDKVHIYLKLNKNKEIEDLSFEGEGCAISLASASILTEIVKGKDLSFLNKYYPCIFFSFENDASYFRKQNKAFNDPLLQFFFHLQILKFENYIYLFSIDLLI